MDGKKLLYQSKYKLNKNNIETSREIGTGLNNDYKGNASSRENGLLVKKMVEEYERNLIGK